MTTYYKKPGEVEANQFFFGRPMIPGVVYPTDRSGDNEYKQRPYIFIDDNDNKQFLTSGDWVIQDEDEDEEGNMQFYVIKPQAFDLIFAQEEERGWISVEDSMPPSHNPVIGYDSDSGRIGAAVIPSWNSGRLIFEDTDDCNITHWQPFPGPPKER